VATAGASQLLDTAASTASTAPASPLGARASVAPGLRTAPPAASAAAAAAAAAALPPSLSAAHVATSPQRGRSASSASRAAYPLPLDDGRARRLTALLPWMAENDAVFAEELSREALSCTVEAVTRRGAADSAQRLPQLERLLMPPHPRGGDRVAQRTATEPDVGRSGGTAASDAASRSSASSGDDDGDSEDDDDSFSDDGGSVASDGSDGASGRGAPVGAGWSRRASMRRLRPRAPPAATPATSGSCSPTRQDRPTRSRTARRSRHTTDAGIALLGHLVEADDLHAASPLHRLVGQLAASAAAATALAEADRLLVEDASCSTDPHLHAAAAGLVGEGGDANALEKATLATLAMSPAGIPATCHASGEVGRSLRPADRGGRVILPSSAAVDRLLAWQGAYVRQVQVAAVAVCAAHLVSLPHPWPSDVAHEGPLALQDAASLAKGLAQAIVSAAECRMLESTLHAASPLLARPGGLLLLARAFTQARVRCVRSLLPSPVADVLAIRRRKEQAASAAAPAPAPQSSASATANGQVAAEVDQLPVQLRESPVWSEVQFHLACHGISVGAFAKRAGVHADALAACLALAGPGAAVATADLPPVLWVQVAARLTAMMQHLKSGLVAAFNQGYATLPWYSTSSLEAPAVRARRAAARLLPDDLRKARQAQLRRPPKLAAAWKTVVWDLLGVGRGAIVERTPLPQPAAAPLPAVPAPRPVASRGHPTGVARPLVAPLGTTTVAAQPTAPQFVIPAPSDAVRWSPAEQRARSTLTGRTARKLVGALSVSGHPTAAAHIHGEWMHDRWLAATALSASTTKRAPAVWDKLCSVCGAGGDTSPAGDSPGWWTCAGGCYATAHVGCMGGAWQPSAACGSCNASASVVGSVCMLCCTPARGLASVTTGAAGSWVHVVCARVALRDDAGGHPASEGGACDVCGSDLLGTCWVGCMEGCSDHVRGEPVPCWQATRRRMHPACAVQTGRWAVSHGAPAAATAHLRWQQLLPPVFTPPRGDGAGPAEPSLVTFRVLCCRHAAPLHQAAPDPFHIVLGAGAGTVAGAVVPPGWLGHPLPGAAAGAGAGAGAATAAASAPVRHDPLTPLVPAGWRVIGSGRAGVAEPLPHVPALRAAAARAWFDAEMAEHAEGGALAVARTVFRAAAGLEGGGAPANAQTVVALQRQWLKRHTPTKQGAVRAAAAPKPARTAHPTRATKVEGTAPKPTPRPAPVKAAAPALPPYVPPSPFTWPTRELALVAAASAASAGLAARPGVHMHRHGHKAIWPSVVTSPLQVLQVRVRGGRVGRGRGGGGGLCIPHRSPSSLRPCPLPAAGWLLRRAGTAGHRHRGARHRRLRQG
jgi:hypothetical protein